MKVAGKLGVSVGAKGLIECCSGFVLHCGQC